MKRISMLLLATGLMVGAAPAALALEDCSCKQIHATGQGWCDKCNSGMAFGVPITSKKLYTALAGTKVDAAKVKCPGCKTAPKDGGTCEHCHAGFHAAQAYHSLVAYTLSQGMHVDPKNVKCPGCKAALTGKDSAGHAAHFCKECDAGFVGPLAFKGRENYDQAENAMTILKAAAKEASHCEDCAVAMVTDGTCEHCKTHFKNGKKITG